VIDLFAGPGGLGEGFSAFEPEDELRFKIALSIERDDFAHATLKLRSFFRQFRNGKVPSAYYDRLREVDEPLHERLKSLFDSYPDQAEKAGREAWKAELGKTDREGVRDGIASALDGAAAWVLIGGPPCQAYSLAGRSRNRGNPDYVPEDDARQYLYVEYLQVIAEHRPAIFVMENVKGLLSASLKNEQVFSRIVKDLRDPLVALKREGRCVQTSGISLSQQYKVFSLVKRGVFNGGDLRSFVVPMEQYGIPQARHRLILLGVRSDLLGSVIPETLRTRKPVSARQVLEGLPRLRSGLSKEDDSASAWLEILQRAKEQAWFSEDHHQDDKGVHLRMISFLEHLASPRCDRGGEFLPFDSASVEHEKEWFLDEHIGGVYNHSTRGHIVDDLYRYFYAACFSKVWNRSPVLSDFPEELLPDHRNVAQALEGGSFADRFRVQLSGRPSTTITSHIAKDGHYYIHYDPTQCRSMTVREAARLQTFPDNYFFCGPRTAQYAQVGNAVPPLIAREIARIVWDLLRQSGALGR